MTNRVAIVDGVRTPFCKSGGALSEIPADDLGTYVVRELLARTGVKPSDIDEVIFGNVAQPVHAANIARVIALKAGLPESTIAHTVHRNCASGMQSLTEAAMQIRTGHADLIIAGGTESMSQIPLLFPRTMNRWLLQLMKSRTLSRKLKTLSRLRPSHFKPVIALEQGLTDPVCELNMGQTAEILASEFHITRDEQDAFALASHQKTMSAQANGFFDDEVKPIVGPPKYDNAQMQDDGVRPDQSMEQLGKLRPYFERHYGTVTAGNSCQITDGAVVLLLASEQKVRELDLEPLGYLCSSAYAATDGAHMGLGPTYATSKLMKREGCKLEDFDLIEINEAFAAQVIANMRAFASSSFASTHLGRKSALGEIDPSRLNVNGGAIAIGHPVGASGTRLVLTTLRELHRRKQKRGLATLCVGGGQGAAVALEAA